jgi:dipeptidyl-peptidase III
MMRAARMGPRLAALGATMLDVTSAAPRASPGGQAAATAAAAFVEMATPAPARPVAEPEAPMVPLRLGIVGDVTVASFPPRGFDRLTLSRRLLAYHLTAAALAGDAIFTAQTSRFALPAQRLVRALLARSERLTPELREKLLQYRSSLFLHHGLHDKWRGSKVPPPLARAELESAARAAGVTPPADLLAAMFDPAVVPRMVDKTPGDGQDPISASAATHYEGLTSKDLVGFEEAFPLNGRLIKRNGRIVEEVYRAGDARTPPGLAAAELTRVVDHLEAAAALAPPAERRALALLASYFRTGDNQLFRKHDIAWLGQIFPVDYIFGFVENYTDVRLRKGAFIGFVAVPDPEHDPPLQALARNAAYFERRLPWLARYKRENIRAPATAAVAVLAATAEGGPFTFGGENLPNAEDLRERYGTKNFVNASVIDTRSWIGGSRFIDEFAPEEDRAELRRCQPSLPYVIAQALRGPVGHHRDPSPSPRTSGWAS